MTKPQDEQNSKATLGRRLASAFYDSLLCIALLMCTTGIYMAINKKVIGSDAYRAMNEAGQTIHDPLLSSVLFTTLFLFFAYFWTKTGQTLGMQVWCIRVQRHDGQTISWRQALVRFVTAIISFSAFGLGYIWMLVDKQGRTWQCIASGTVVVRTPKPQKN
jgi:uncharacterized RDD family membrane protein YckC